MRGSAVFESPNRPTNKFGLRSGIRGGLPFLKVQFLAHRFPLETPDLASADKIAIIQVHLTR